MKYLFVGDVHNHSYIFNDVQRLNEQYDFNKIVFLGDYVDDWLTDNHQSLETLDTVINLKRENPDKYFFTLGNHELSYLGFKCSGHHFLLEDIMELKLKENIECFEYFVKMTCGNKDYICTHAGLTNDYINNVLGGASNWEKNLITLSKEKLLNLPIMAHCSYSRGGSDQESSFVWADRREHILFNTQLEEPIVPNQIIGHSPVKEINLHPDYGNFIFIDTHSTYRDGSQYGDRSYLMWNEDHFEVVK